LALINKTLQFDMSFDAEITYTETILTSAREAYWFAIDRRYVADETCPIVALICSQPKYAYYYMKFIMSMGHGINGAPSILRTSPKYACKFAVNIARCIVPELNDVIMNSKYMPEYFMRCHIKHDGPYTMKKVTYEKKTGKIIEQKKIDVTDNIGR